MVRGHSDSFAQPGNPDWIRPSDGRSAGDRTSPTLASYRPEDNTLIALTAIVVLGVIAALHHVGVAVMSPYWPMINVFVYLNVLFYVVFGDCAYQLFRHRPDRPFHFIAAHAKRPAYYRRLAFSLPLIAALAVFMSFFSALKSSIELFAPFTWDADFIALDRTLHGGDPWRLLQPLLGHPAITAFLSGIYHLWFMLIYIGPVYFAIFQTDRTLRLRFFLSYFLTWIICGMFFAIIFSSVGPCFVEPILGNTYFSDQMAYLREVDARYPLFVIEIQQQLLDWYRSGEHGLGSGITSMPSMHVALAFLYVLVMHRINRTLTWVFAIFCLMILLGSVHLAYHYAIDGYFSIAVTALIWFATAPMARQILRAAPAHNGTNADNH